MIVLFSINVELLNSHVTVSLMLKTMNTSSTQTLV